MIRQKKLPGVPSPRPSQLSQHRGMSYFRKLDALAVERPFVALTGCFILFLLIWLPTLTTFSYNNSSDLGFHLYNLKQFGDTGFSFYNAQWFTGQEYLTVYSPGTAMLGSLFSWMAPGITGAMLAYAVLVGLAVLCSLFGAAHLARQLGGSPRVMIATAVLYTFSPFLWRGLSHSLPDFIGYACLPGLLAYWLFILAEVSRTSAFTANLVRRAGTFGIICAGLFLTSTIIAFHAAACLLLVTAVWCVQRKSFSWPAWLTLALSALVAVGCTAFWLFPFVETLGDPGYGGDKLSLANGGTWMQSIAASVTSRAVLSDVISLVSPLSRHRFPLLLLLIICLSWPAVKLLSSRLRQQLQPWILVAVFGALVGISSTFGALASGGLGILLENERWFDVVHLSLSLIAGVLVGTLFDSLWASTAHAKQKKAQRARTSRLRTATVIVLVCITLVSGVLLAVSSKATDSVWKTNARLSPLYKELQQDAVSERVAVFPFLDFVPGDLEHSRPMLFGSCLACNRNEKITLMQVFEPIQFRTTAGSIPAGLSETVTTDRLAQTLSFGGVRSILVTNARVYPELNLSTDYPVTALLQQTQGITLVAGSRTTEQVPAWIFTLNGEGWIVPGENASNMYAFEYPRTARNAFWCSLFGAVSYSIPPLTFTCTDRVLRIAPGILFGVFNGSTEASVVLPRGVSPVVDRILLLLGPLRYFLPFVTVTQTYTTVVVVDSLYRVDVDLPHVVGPVILDRVEATRYSGTVSAVSTNNSVLIREGYAPQWKVRIAGTEVAVQSERGFLSFSIPSNASVGAPVKVSYERSRAANTGWVLTVSTLLALLALHWARIRLLPAHFLNKPRQSSKPVRRASKRS